MDIGDRVKKDSVLFTLDDQDLQTDRSSKLIEIEAAKLQLEKAKRDYERSKQLYADKLISQELFEDTKTQYELARNALDRADKALHLVEYQLTKTKILAPFEIFDYEAVKCAPHYGRIRHELEQAGETIGAMDLLIAAHALGLDATVVTNNLAHFRRVSGLKVTDWR